jgi:urate oxidase
MKILETHYGKSQVRVARIVRDPDHHDFHEMTVATDLQGDFDASYAEGDNSRVVATDSMKNMIYGLAADPAVAQPESFGLLLARELLGRYSHVSRARIELAEHVWQRHARFSFTAGAAHRRVARIDAVRDHVNIEGGVAGFVLLRTAGSAFEGFIRDSWTTLPETSDRIMATSLDATWRYRGGGISWGTSWHGVMRLITDTFAEHDSKSVQHTLHAIGETVLAQCEHIDRIRLVMPNKHYLQVKGDVFCPTDEPHGIIEATLCR